MMSPKSLSKPAASVLALTVLLTACTSPEERKKIISEQQNVMAQRKANYTAEVAAVMGQVQPHVTARHLEECRQTLEKGKTVLATEYKMVGQFHPHVGFSCYAQGRDKSNLFSVERPAIGYMARFEKVGKGFGPDHTPGFCAFVLDGKQLTLATWQRSATTHGRNTCAGL